jgi:hypothetical protein
MKSRKNILIIVLAVLVIARIVIIQIENRKTAEKLAEDQTSNDIAGTVKVVTPESSNVTDVEQNPSEAATNHTTPDQADQCHTLREKYQSLKDLPKSEKTSIRFVNIHKKVDGVVYRTRFFYKDSSENEVPTYLLYREDQNDEPVLVETTKYKKGPKYLEIEKAQGNVVYTEEGVNLGPLQSLFLHYENKELKDLQGSNDAKNFIECRF